jgi:peroxiredoxin
MSRRILVLGSVLACFALILWSGYQNRYVQPSTPGAASPALAGNPSAAQRTDVVTSPLVGQSAPSFTLRDLAGHQVRLRDYRGRAVLINFWATWCAPCQLEMPWFIDLQRRYAAKGFVVIGIDKDYPEDLPKVPGFARKMGLNYPVLYGNGKTYAAYECCDYLPMSYYVDREGTVRIATVGLGERDTVEANVRRILGASPPPLGTQITASTAAAPLQQPK